MKVKFFFGVKGFLLIIFLSSIFNYMAYRYSLVVENDISCLSGEVIDFKDGGKRGGARVVLKDDSGVFIQGRVSFPGAADISVGELYEYCFFEKNRLIIFLNFPENVIHFRGNGNGVNFKEVISEVNNYYDIFYYLFNFSFCVLVVYLVLFIFLKVRG